MTSREVGVCRIGHGRFPAGTRCMPCRRIYETKRAKELIKKRTDERSLSPEEYKCTHDGCDEILLVKRSRCHSHRARSNTEQAKHDADRLRAISEARTSRSGYLTATNKCKLCHEPIMTGGGMHYSCATGKPREIVGPVLVAS